MKQLNVQEITDVSKLPQPGFFESYWGVMLLIILGMVAFGVLIYFVVKWIDKIKNPPGIMDDKIEALISNARRLAKKEYFKSFFSPSKNAPIRLMWKEKGELKTQFWGWYMGDMISETGFRLLLFTNRSVSWLLFFIPKVEAIWLPKTGEFEIKNEYNQDKHQYKITKIVGLPHNIEHFTSEEVLIWATSMDEEKGLYKPVLLDGTTNEPINTNMVAFAQVETCALKDFLYHTTNAYVDNTRQGFEMNTKMMGAKKLNDVGGEITQ